MAFARKCQPLYDLHPDIAVIPECSKNDLQPGLFDHFDARWFGDNPRKGLGVLVAKPLRIIRAEKPPNRWVVPLSISGGASDFRLIAVWAMPVKGSVVKSYIGQVYEAIANHPHWFPSTAFVGAGLQPGVSSPDALVRAGRNFSRERQSPIGASSPHSVPPNPKPVILCGDFNSNKIWDDHRKTHNHSAVVSLLEQRGLLSAYHHFFSEPQGHETRPTYYFWHRQNRGYHIDYVFLPRAWASCIQSVTLGHHANWSHLSDHVPLSIDLTVPAS
ncbi:MAG TPA: endonuclease/exonuclease/phosphatase family protein [Candidatus Acidoferrum sp.]|nr:endonuclease/exonuclease/phosphatase family protein [Candidatus Acidoferrum sp.]